MTTLSLQAADRGTRVRTDAVALHAQALMFTAFKRTHRLAEGARPQGLPPGLGNFPLVDVKALGRYNWLDSFHGGVAMPVHDNEAMWIDFSTPDSYPFAVQIAAGRVCALTGKTFTEELVFGDNQNFVVPGTLHAPGRQRWLDGWKTAEGVVRQFVAVRRGDGQTVEEQLTGWSVHGGLQLRFTPIRPDVWETIRPRPYSGYGYGSATRGMVAKGGTFGVGADMGVGAGAEIRQEVARSTFNPADFRDMEAHAAKLWVTLVPADCWATLTGHLPPAKPADAPAPYTAPQQGALPGAKPLADINPVGKPGISEGSW